MGTRNGMRPVHPGEILGEELRELGVSANALAKKLAVPTNRVTEIAAGKGILEQVQPRELSKIGGVEPPDL